MAVLCLVWPCCDLVLETRRPAGWVGGLVGRWAACRVGGWLGGLPGGWAGERRPSHNKLLPIHHLPSHAPAAGDLVVVSSVFGAVARCGSGG